MSDLQLKALEELFEQNKSLKQHRKDDTVQTLNKAGGPKVTYDVVQKWWHDKQRERCWTKKRKAAARHGPMSDLQLKALEELFEQNQSLKQHNKDDTVQTLNKAGGPKVTVDVVQKWWHDKQKERRLAEIRQAAARHGPMSDLQLKALEELFEQNQSLKQHHQDDIVQTLNKAGGPKVTVDVVQKWWHDKQIERRRTKKRKAAGQAESTHKRQRKSP